MLIQKIEISNLRAIKYSTIEFKPGMNLLVGVNGVGKTTVLEAIRVCLSQVLNRVISKKVAAEKFQPSDITVGESKTNVTCYFTWGEEPFSLSYLKERFQFQENQSSDFRRNITKTPDKISTINIERVRSLIGTEQPIAVFFSSKRSLVDGSEPKKKTTIGGRLVAYAEALSPDRSFNQRLFADWYKAQEALAKEIPIAGHHLTALQNAVSSFLPEFSNLHVVENDGKNLFMLSKNGLAISIAQMSDGERGILSLVMDLAKRLSQANPDLEDPVSYGKAIVLIDEIDLHLHPQWQRTIVDNLTRTFHNCQFIASTHSPQIIPEVEPEQVALLTGNDVIIPDRTLGMDSNWILKHLLGTTSRPKDADDAIREVEEFIIEGAFDKAREAINAKTEAGYDLVEWPALEARMARIELLSTEDDEEE